MASCELADILPRQSVEILHCISTLYSRVPVNTEPPEPHSEIDSRMSEITEPSDGSECCGPVLETPVPSDWSADDITLFNHFTNSTYHDIGRGPMSRQLAGKPLSRKWPSVYGFLKHGILACSSPCTLHTSTLLKDDDTK